MSDWHIFTGSGTPPETPREFPDPPAWRVPGEVREEVLAATFRSTPELVAAVNAAIYLRRPLLVKGNPGSGKSSLIFAAARELGLGKVLTWPINSRSTLREALYNYDALARLQVIQERQASKADPRDGNSDPVDAEPVNSEPNPADDIGQFITLGPLGTALASVAGPPRALLVDEIDKSDVDLPNDLLNVLDTGRFTIPELRRLTGKKVKVTDSDDKPIEVDSGEITFSKFPFVVMTSNGERDFPAPFLRRCVQFTVEPPTREELREIVLAHFKNLSSDDADLRTERTEKDGLLGLFHESRDERALSTDQLLNAVHVFRSSGAVFSKEDRDLLLNTLFRKLN